MEKLNLNARWIWDKENTLINDIVVFRKHFEVTRLPQKAIAYISADTKYYLYINGSLVVFEGGLFRESKKGCGYADEVDIAKYLKIGSNVISVLVWFYGNGGRNSVNSKKAGFLFDCEALQLFSNSDFKVLRHSAYYNTTTENPSYLYGGHNIAFNFNNDIGDYNSLDFDDSNFSPSTEYENEVWGDLYKRPIPLHKFSDLIECEQINAEDNKYIVDFPYALQFTPYIEVEAKGGEIIDIRSDRYNVNGGPGDTGMYQCHRMEMTCKKGLNIFNSINYLYGEKMIITSNVPVTFKKIAYHESGYNTEIVGEFNCDDELLNKLVQKSARTLYVCMRDNFMDCPDRERGQWIGDVSVQIPQVFFALDEKAQLLAKKAIYDFFNLRIGDALYGNVPGEHYGELPSQSLNAISELGMVANYYKYTGDVEILKFAFEPSVNYLKLWGMGENGLVLGRKGNWRWFDHLYNVDEDVLENCWYYSALKFAKTMANVCDNHSHDSFINERMASIEANFESFWKDKFYSSKGVVDDRANAMAVLSGLCPKERYVHIHKVLITTFNSSAYMENYVLCALCEMGCFNNAYKRMMSRFYNLAVNENSTLWEDFYILGTRNHAWTGAPLVIAFKYLMGIDTSDGFKTFTVKPVDGLFKSMNCKFKIHGRDVSISYKDGKVDIIQ